MKPGFAHCDVCGNERSGVRVCEVLDPVSWRTADRVRACGPCRTKKKLTALQYERARPMAWV